MAITGNEFGSYLARAAAIAAAAFVLGCGEGASDPASIAPASDTAGDGPAASGDAAGVSGSAGGSASVGAAAVAESEAAAGVPIDPELPVFESDAALAGSLKSIGSDTMLQLSQLWAAAFQERFPAVRVEVEGKGSSTAPPALMENQAQFGPMSRAMDPEEIEAFEAAHGYAPAELRVAVDCVAVFVHRDNPVESLTIGDLEQIFSVAGPEQMTWGDVGVTDAAWANRPISTYGRNSASGTYKYFKDVALSKRDYKGTVKDQPGSAGVVSAIATDPNGVGYSGVGYTKADVKTVPLRLSAGDPPATPDLESAYSGEYPLARFLYVYMDYDRREALDPLREQFVRLIFSRDGQEAVVRDGAYPVPASVAREDLAKVGLEPGF